MKNDRGFEILKIMVVAMGVFLMIGIAALFYLVYQRQARTAVPESPASALKITKKGEGACSGGDIKIKEEGEIISSDIKGQYLVITMKPTNKAGSARHKIIMVDYCSGSIVSRVEIGG